MPLNCPNNPGGNYPQNKAQSLHMLPTSTLAITSATDKTTQISTGNWLNEGIHEMEYYAAIINTLAGDR